MFKELTCFPFWYNGSKYTVRRRHHQVYLCYGLVDIVNFTDGLPKSKLQQCAQVVIDCTDPLLIK